MRLIPGLLAAATVGAAVFALPASAEFADSAKLRGDLASVMDQAAPNELIPISIVLKDQVPGFEIARLGKAADKKQARADVINRLKSEASASSARLMQDLQAEQARGAVGARLRSLWIANVIATEATPEVIARIASRDDVAYVNYDRPISREVFPIDPVTEDQGALAGGRGLEYGVEIMRADEVWNDLGITGEGVVVGIIDTGCCIAHPDIENQLWTNPGEIPNNNIDDDNNGYVDDVVGYNFWENTNDVYDSGGHGTHTAGTVCGDGTDGTNTGMAPDCQMMILKFWNSFSGESVVWEAMQYAADNDADIVTASIGWPHWIGPDRPTWRSVCENTIAAGVVVIYASGNEGSGSPPDNVRTPGDVPDVITIGATDSSDNLASFSSTGPVTWQDIPPYYDFPYPPGKVKPSVSAPGVDTISCRYSPCYDYTSMSGTSMATPHVAGAAALILQANGNLDHFGVKQILMDTSVDLGDQGIDNYFGAGRVDAYEAVVEAMNQNTYGDVNNDGLVDIDDIFAVLAAWGPCAACPEDVNTDGYVDIDDIFEILANWT